MTKSEVYDSAMCCSTGVCGVDAETTPVLEAAGLQEELRRAGIEPWAWLINNSLSAATTSSPLLKQRAAFELAQIEAVRTRYATRVALVPMQDKEPIGIERLLNLVDPQPAPDLAVVTRRVQIDARSQRP